MNYSVFSHIYFTKLQTILVFPWWRITNCTSWTYPLMIQNEENSNYPPRAKKKKITVFFSSNLSHRDCLLISSSDHHHFSSLRTHEFPAVGISEGSLLLVPAFVYSRIPVDGKKKKKNGWKALEIASICSQFNYIHIKKSNKMTKIQTSMVLTVSFIIWWAIW